MEFDETRFKSALNRVAATTDGKIVLAMIKESCQWDMTYIASDNPQVAHHYSTLRGVYGGLRQYIDKKHLKEIEFDITRKVKQNDRGNSSKPKSRLSGTKQQRRSTGKPKSGK